MGDVGSLAFDLNAIAQRLRELGETGLARQLTKKVRAAVEPVPDRIRGGLPPKLPDPYAAVLNDDLNIRISTSTKGAEARISVVATTRGGKRRRIRRLDDGTLWHPVFGNRRKGRYQAVTSGWFTRPAEESQPEVRDAVEQAMRDVAEAAVGKGVVL